MAGKRDRLSGGIDQLAAEIEEFGGGRGYGHGSTRCRVSLCAVSIQVSRSKRLTWRCQRLMPVWSVTYPMATRTSGGMCSNSV
ncbi:hypothetical protein GCM10020369_78120 [Cryptosporangium minutisporangium]|uniref:Uncharacterized protein n=1 Tax=Cryptosporangium minutisporangium TaxID=113569 RepID=A0ABP6TC36_9ACTN